MAVCDGSDFSLHVNGTELDSFSDDAYSSGGIALFVENLSDTPLEVHYGYLALIAP
jgi:hypothetical protein